MPDSVAEQTIPNPDGDVRVFRVDFEEGERPEPRTRHCLSPLVLVDLKVPAQFPQRGVGALPLSEVRKTSVVVRAYRRGYKLFEAKPGGAAEPWRWEPAYRGEQEAVIEQLLGIPPEFAKYEWWETIARKPLAELAGSRPCPPFLGDSGLMPGSVSPVHRHVLLYAADEFTDLSRRTAWAEKERRGRLEKKAEQIRRWADE